MELGQRIKTLRRSKGLSQENLAKQLGISRQAISKWEAGISQPDIDNIIQLCKTFEISADDLLEINKISVTETFSCDLPIHKDGDKKYQKGAIISFLFSFFLIMFVYILTICKHEIREAENSQILHLWNLTFWLQNDLLPLGILILICIILGMVLIFKYISADTIQKGE